MRLLVPNSATHQNVSGIFPMPTGKDYPAQFHETRERQIQAALEEYLETEERGDSVDHDSFLAKYSEVASELESYINESG